MNKFNYKNLYDELDKKREEKNLSWTAIGKELRIAPSTLKRTEKGTPMEADGIRAMVAWLNLAPEDFVYSSNGAAIPQAIKCLTVSNGMLRRFDKIALFAALNNKRLTNNLSWQQVTKEIGNVSIPILKNLSKGGRISIDVAVSITGWLKQSIESFTYESTQ